MPEISKFDALHKLIKKGDVISLRRELDAGAPSNLSNRFSWTLLMLAAIEGNTPIGELLLSRGADINAVNDFGETALSLAAHGGHIQFIRTLLTHGSAIDCQPHGQTLERWLTVSTGLPQERIASIIDLLNKAKSRSAS
jgi:ankyrin repeat protein